MKSELESASGENVKLSIAQRERGGTAELNSIGKVRVKGKQIKYNFDMGITFRMMDGSLFSLETSLERDIRAALFISDAPSTTLYKHLHRDKRGCLRTRTALTDASRWTMSSRSTYATTGSVCLVVMGNGTLSPP